MPTFGNLLNPGQIARARQVFGYNSHCASASCDCHRCLADHALVAYLRCDALLRRWRQPCDYGSWEAAQVARQMQEELQMALRATGAAAVGTPQEGQP